MSSAAQGVEHLRCGRGIRRLSQYRSSVDNDCIGTEAHSIRSANVAGLVGSYSRYVGPRQLTIELCFVDIHRVDIERVARLGKQLAPAW